MTEKQYQKLLDRIKFDLYQEFINPDTAHYGMKYLEKAENDDTIYEGILSEREILQDELGRLCSLQNKYIDNEEYEKAAVLKNRIIKLQLKIDKL
jgi:protein-arginine kinase activator protein McsA|tara:strand:+ start:809 stop:1093 length:285 start_codon:yes stop_codon:yes gene_type:complete